MAFHPEPVTIGLLFSQTGVTSVIERTQRQAAMLAVEEINDAGGIDGREILIEDSDPASDPVRFKSEAERLIDVGATTIFGCYMSSTRKAVLPVVEQRRALLFYPTLYEGFEFSSSCVYSGAAPNQNSRWLADYLTDTYGDRFVFVGSNYVFPYESNRIMRDLLLHRGAQVLDEVYIPLRHNEDYIERAIARIKAAGPAVVFSTVVGEGSVRFYQAYDRAGFDRSVQPIASLTTGEPELLEVGKDASIGNVTAAPYFSVLKTEANLRFVAAYHRRFGPDHPISAGTEAAYFQVHLFAEAVRRAGATDRDSVLRSLPTFSYEAPQGAVQVEEATHHTSLWPRVAVVGENGQFEIVREAAAPVKPDPYLIEYDKEFQLAAPRTGTRGSTQ
ncbi:transporter substrate-binding domain-containing protein [Thioclava atlantica]|uniref:Aliphatic amidase expression-regulating protein AmiC n=1 Tax=Thioclava atlantica TaxID=1317124 RepID=A0A085TZN4_9RHOB|nr:transporter substrate-binding domain-containing protein [Thioclava atlantica]KFE36181.1 aliphatic amidase expression-regulating protein AmiC [Thioclava atlantica]